VLVCDIPGAFMYADIDEVVHDKPDKKSQLTNVGNLTTASTQSSYGKDHPQSRLPTISFN
jgi:hypothetical protein